MRHFLLALLFIPALFSHEINIRNQTSTDMLVNLEFGGSGFCSPETWLVKAGTSKTEDVGLCCAKPNVTFIGVKGSLNKQAFSYNPPRTGCGLSCLSWSADIIPAGDNFIVQKISW